MDIKDLLNKLLPLLQEGNDNNAYKTFFIKNRKNNIRENNEF